MKYLPALAAVCLLIVPSVASAQQLPGDPNPHGTTVTVTDYNHNWLKPYSNSGTIQINSGAHLENKAAFNAHATLTNESTGTINNDGKYSDDLVSFEAAVMENYGTFNNNSGANLVSHGTFLNEGGSTLNNRGTLNSRYLRNNGTLNNSGSWTTPWNGTTTYNYGTLTNKDGGTLTNDGTLINEPAGTLTNDGTFDNWSSLTNDGTLTNNNSGRLGNLGWSSTLTNNGTLNNNGWLWNFGTIDTTNGTLTNYDTISGDGHIKGSYTDYGNTKPGNSAGVMTIDGDYFKVAGSKEIELGGLFDGGGDNALAEFDRIDVTGNVELAGVLHVELIDGFEKRINRGQVFEFLRVGGTLSGQYEGLGEGALVGNFGGQDLFITYGGMGDGGGVALFTNAVPEPTTVLIWSMLAGLGMTVRRRR